ncbi:MAG: type IX secretion system sortase PorU [Bacteroidota bacterium]
MTPLLRLAAVLAILLAAVPASSQSSSRAPSGPFASGQVPPEGATVRILEETPGAVTYEITARWSRAITEAGTPESADALATRLVGNEATATALVPLGARVPPRVEVLSVDTEDARVPGAERVVEAFEGPLAEVVAVGTRRKQPVGSLRVRLLRVEGDRVTRVRRAIVRVNRMAPQTGVARKLGGGSSHLGVTRSTLAEGRWFKLPVPETGVYRVDRTLIEALGLDPATVDPARVAAYHNGGAPLPELGGTPRPADLVETPSLVIGGGDGRFDEGDAVLLYAEGPQTWAWDTGFASDPDDDAWSHTLNPFARETAVFLRVDAASPMRVGPATFPGWSDAQVLTSVTGRIVAERDLANLEREGSGSGLHWLGEELTRTSAGVTVLDTIPPNLASEVRYRAQVAARANPSISISISKGGQTLDTVTPPGVQFGSATGYLARIRTAEATIPVQGSLALTVRAPSAPGNATAWLDWAEATFQRAPRATNGVAAFPTPGGLRGRFEVALEGFAAAPEVWDVTTPGEVARLGVQADGGRYRVQVEAIETEREIIAFDPGASLRTFAGGTPVANQNLHGLTSFPDYIVITPEVLAPAAERLAAHREADGLETLVVTVDQITNEFGGGIPDMRAIRDFMKFLYDRADTEARLPQHLLLFGDGHYDYRGIKNGPPSLVPTYQTDEMLWRERSYTSDDYFALLDDDEGAWVWSGSASTSSFERVDLGVGRLPITTLEEAETMVDKIIGYENTETFGDWRSRFTFLADDQYPNSFDNDLHVQNADAVAVRIPDSTGVIVQKIYMPSYPEVTGATGRRRPGATEASRRAIEEGTLVWNYMGHGGPEGLADEQLFTASVVDGLSNAEKLPIFVTATCSFGKYDQVDSQSLAEETLLREGGGAVAMFTTVRVVVTFISTESLNLGLNIQLTRAMLERDAEGRPRRLGDILADAKNTDVGAELNNRKFNLLGDPAMRIGLPERRVLITHINGVPLPAGAAPELRAFETARVQGQVLRFDGTPDAAFEGEVALNVFDAERDVQLPVRVNTPGFYTVQTDPIYAGRASVRSGAFDATFLVPQDVSYSGQAARITTYALGDDGSGLTDGLGQSREALVSQTAGARPNDPEGPEIRLFLDDTTFVSGGIARPDPTLIARLRDPSGINTVGAGVGHELLLTIDGDPTRAVDVGRSYEGDLDDFTSGTVRFPLPTLAPGPHSLTLTAWDGANNASTEVLEFVVTEDTDLLVENAYPYPNPTPGRSTFFFEHNQAPGTPARVQLRIYSLAGRPVRTMEMDGPLTGGLVRLDWDGLDDDADPLASGIYLYRLRVEVDGDDGARRVAERRDKLAVIR